MPNSLTRRQLLKELGLVGAGVTLAPALSFTLGHSDPGPDSQPSGPGRPSWVRTVARPTTEIDWAQVQRYDERNTCRAGFVKYVGKERVAQLTELQKENLARFLKQGNPGYTLKDFALKGATDGLAFLPRSFLGPQKALTPKDRGVPSYQGTPEEAAQIVRAAMRHLGAATVGFVELDPRTTEKLIYSVDPDGKQLDIVDADQPAEEKDRRIIPRKARWVIVYTVQMSGETLKRAPTQLGAQTTTLTYDMANAIQMRTQEFLRGLGYMGLGEATINALGISPAFGVMAGLGELSRYNRLLTPEYGSMARVFKLVTDLPLAPDKPIDAGLLRFCKSCMKCAEWCPSKALSFAPEPYWEVKGDWNNPGHKAWFEDSVKCRSYWFETGNNCGICFAVCPFSNANKAAVHEFMGLTIAATSLFNVPAKAIHDFVYGPGVEVGQALKDPEEWWRLDLAEYGIDTSRGHQSA